MTGFVLSLISIVYINCPQDNMRGWIYRSDTNQITICKNFEEEDGYILLHEASHWFWFNKLSDKEREDYKKIWFKSTFYVTEYAKTSIEEDFAETSRAILMGGKYRNNHKLSFVRKLHKKYWFINSK